MPVDLDHVKQIEKYLDEIESICEKLRVGETGSEEAIHRLRDILESTSK